MKCPNCGSKLQEGLLYCEKCGGDIHIVPDFEPELEENMQESLQQIAEAVGIENNGQSIRVSLGQTARGRKMSGQITQMLSVLLGICAVVLAFAVVFIGAKMFF